MAGEGQITSALDSVNDTRSWQKQIDALGRAGGGVFRAARGSYRLLEVSIPSGVSVVIPPDVQITKDGGDASTVVFRMAGAKSGVTSPLSADGHAGDQTVTVNNGALFAAGRMVMVSDQTFKYSTFGQNLELNRVQSIAGNVLTLQKPLRHNYATASGAAVDDLNAVENASIVCEGMITQAPGTLGGIFFGFLCEGCTATVRGIGPRDLPGACFTTSRGCGFYRGEIRDGQTSNLGGTSYGFEFGESSHDCWAFRCRTVNVRENPITNNSQDITVTLCDDEGGVSSGWNSHGTGCERIKFIACRHSNPVQYGFNVSGSGNGAGDLDVSLEGCEVYGAGSTGISVGGDVGKETRNVTLTNCKVIGFCLKTARRGGFEIGNVIGGKVLNCDADGLSNANVDQGFEIASCTKVDVVSCRSRNVAYGYQQSSGVDLNFSDLWAENCSSLTYRSVVAGTRIKWNRCRADTTAMSLLGGDIADLDSIRDVSADRGDASVTLTAWINEGTQLFATALTANRTVTLATPAFKGARFRIVRTGLGAFTLDVGGLKTLPAGTAAFADVAYDGAAWKLTGFGTL